MRNCESSGSVWSLLYRSLMFSKLFISLCQIFYFEDIEIINELWKIIPSYVQRSNLCLVFITISPPNKLPSAKFLICFNFSKCFNVNQSCWKFCLSVKQLEFGQDAELLGISSGSKLFAYDTIVVIGGLRVNLWFWPGTLSYRIGFCVPHIAFLEEHLCQGKLKFIHARRS